MQIREAMKVWSLLADKRQEYSLMFDADWMQEFFRAVEEKYRRDKPDEGTTSLGCGTPVPDAIDLEVCRVLKDVFGLDCRVQVKDTTKPNSLALWLDIVIMPPPPQSQQEEKKDRALLPIVIEVHDQRDYLAPHFTTIKGPSKLRKWLLSARVPLEFAAVVGLSFYEWDKHRGDEKKAAAYLASLFDTARVDITKYVKEGTKMHCSHI